MRDTHLPVCAAALRDPPGRVSVCADSGDVADVHKRDRSLQHRALEPARVPSPLALLHVQVPQQDPSPRLDVPRRNIALHYRYTN